MKPFAFTRKIGWSLFKITLWILALLALALVIAALLVGCDMPPPAPKPTPGKTPTAPTTAPSPTATAAPTATPTVTLDSTATALPASPTAPANTPTPPRATATATTPPPSTSIPTSGTNLFVNPTFTGRVVNHTYPEINVREGWQPYYCAEPHTPEPCPAEWGGSKNPPDLVMGRPEYKPVSGGQSWFCFMRTCDAGIYQVVDTLPGHYYWVSFTAQLWSEDGKNPDGQESHSKGWWGTLPDGSGWVFGPDYSSDLAGADDLINARLYIAIDLRGTTFGFAEHLVYSSEFGYWKGCYRLVGDEWCTVEMAFVANSYVTTIFLGARFAFPFAHNDVIMREAAAYGASYATPTPMVP